MTDSPVAGTAPGDSLPLTGRGPDAPLDRLAVVGIEAVGHHGVFEFERRDGQVFRADLVLGVDTRGAAASDDLQDTVDYGTLVAAVKRAILGLVVLDAVLATAFVGLPGLAILLLLPPAMLLGKWVYST